MSGGNSASGKLDISNLLGSEEDQVTVTALPVLAKGASGSSAMSSVQHTFLPDDESEVIDGTLLPPSKELLKKDSI